MYDSRQTISSLKEMKYVTPYIFFLMGIMVVSNHVVFGNLVPELDPEHVFPSNQRTF
jgi:hypothetical protein